PVSESVSLVDELVASVSLELPVVASVVGSVVASVVDGPLSVPSVGRVVDGSLVMFVVEVESVGKESEEPGDVVDGDVCDASDVLPVEALSAESPSPPP
ncbi:MAG: hypothetical protein ACPG4T_22675, partial [Nannocystaceae bacterium]